MKVEIVEYSKECENVASELFKLTNEIQNRTGASDKDMLLATLAVAMNFATGEAKGDTWDDASNYLAEQIGDSIGLIP